MSAYSGFANRQLEGQYNQLISLLFLTMSKRLVKFYKEEECNEKAFRGVFCRIVGGLKVLEQSKYIPPKFSETMKSLYDLVQQLELKDQDKQSISVNGFEEIQQEANKILIPKIDEGSQQRLAPVVHKNIGMPPHPMSSNIIEAGEISIDKIQPSPSQMTQQTFLTDEQKGTSLQPIQIRTKVQVRSQENQYVQLPTLKNQNDVQISQELVDQIAKNVEQQLLSKLTFKKKRGRSKKKSFAHQQLVNEFQNDAILNRTHNHVSAFSRGISASYTIETNTSPFQRASRGFAPPDGYKTRPKFYSVTSRQDVYPSKI